MTPGGSGNQDYKHCCIGEQFDPRDWNVRQITEVAGDQQFKQPNPNWWTDAEHGHLPNLTRNLLDVMDDERWYVYEVSKKVTR